MTRVSRSLSRRSLLKWSCATAGVVLAGGLGGLLALRGRAAKVAGLRCLSSYEYRTLTALAAVLYPRGGAFPLGAEDLDLARDFDAFLADAPSRDRRDLKRGLLLLEYGPVLFDGRLATFSNLPATERLAHFESWTVAEADARRQLALALRKFVTVRFYDRPEAWAHIGYEGPLVNRPAPARG